MCVTFSSKHIPQCNATVIYCLLKNSHCVLGDSMNLSIDFVPFFILHISINYTVPYIVSYQRKQQRSAILLPSEHAKAVD